MEINELHTILAGAGKNLDAYLVKSLLIISPNLVYVYDLIEKRYVFISGEAPFILGSSADEILAMKEAVNTRLVHPEDLPNLDDHYRQCAEASDGDLIEVEYRIKHVYGDWHWLSARDTPLVLVKREKPRYVLGVAEDISERRAAQEKVWYVSTHDQLTGIFNRAYFEAEIERMEKSRRYPISILYVDVDGLRSVNNQHGQPAGDELLRGTAQVLLGAFRAEDVVARLGGDEFAVILPNTGTVSTDAILARVKTHLNNHNQSHRNIPLSLALGIATVEYGQSLREAFKDAERKMYDAKESQEK
jgi:diguanylate cyclase (GGDEF)-like protein/PAS domain S-box-containing protein